MVRNVLEVYPFIKIALAVVAGVLLAIPTMEVVDMLEKLHD